MKNFFAYTIVIALFVTELSFHFLPKVLHEIFGVTMAAAIIFHVAINRRRFMYLTKKFTSRKIFSVTLNFTLIICAAIILSTGVCLSNYLFAEAVSFELQRNMTIHQLHVAAPYVMMILIGVHVGLHWQELRQKFLRRFGSIKLFDTAAIILSAWGAMGLALNRVCDRILMKHVFMTPAIELPAILFALMIFGGVIFFALITFTINKKL